MHGMAYYAPWLIYAYMINYLDYKISLWLIIPASSDCQTTGQTVYFNVTNQEFTPQTQDSTATWRNVTQVRGPGVQIS